MNEEDLRSLTSAINRLSQNVAASSKQSGNNSNFEGGSSNPLNTRVGVGGTGLRAFFSLPAERIQLIIQTAVRKGFGAGIKAGITGGKPTLAERIAGRKDEVLKDPKFKGKSEKLINEEVAIRNRIDKTETFAKGVGLATTAIFTMVTALTVLRDSLIRTSQELGGVSMGKAFDERVSAFVNSLSTGLVIGAGRILETQGALAQETGRLATSGSALELTKVAQSYGLTAKQLVGLERTLQSTAQSSSEALNAFREQGIVSGVASEELTKNAGAVARAGSKFNEFIVKGIANAKRLGLEFGKIEQTLTGFSMDFEGTVESFAQTRALIPGLATDFSELMSVALNGSTDDLINIVRRDLQGAGITSVSQLNRPQLASLEQSTGFTTDQIDRILNNEDINFDAQVDLDTNRNHLLKGIIIATTAAAGAIVGAIIGMFGGLNPGAYIGAAAGAATGAAAGLVAVTAVTGNDIVSKPGYGERTLVTPAGNIALNNNDTLVAGTDLYGKGEISSQQAGYRSLETRLDKLIMLQERSLGPKEINITGFDKAIESQQQNAIRNY